MSESRVYPTIALRRLIEEAWNSDADPGAKRGELEMVAAQLRTIQGTIGNYLGSLDKAEQAKRVNHDLRMIEARERADIREEMIRRGQATPEELDKRGYLSHRQLDAAEAGEPTNPWQR